MKWDLLTVGLLVGAVAALGLALAKASTAPAASGGVAALAALAGLVIIERAALGNVPRSPRRRIEEPVRIEPLRAVRLDRDAFARRDLYDSLATLSRRVLGPERDGFSNADAEQVCAAPPEQFRAWVAARLDELERAT